MANRVVDEQNVETQFTWREIHSLLDDLHHIKEPPIEVYSEQQLSKFTDDLVRRLCIKMNDTITRLPFEHESLLLDRKEQKLSSAEKRFAFCDYQARKRGIGVNSEFSAAFNAMRTPMTSRNFSNPYNVNQNYIPYPMPSPSLPSEMTPTPHYIEMSGYPDVSQPLPAFPPQPRAHQTNQFVNFESIAETLVRNGNSVKKVRIPNDLSICVGPNTTVTIRKGDEVMVIQTQKGLYLRTNNGNIIAIKNYGNFFGSQDTFTPISKMKDSFGVSFQMIFVFYFFHFIDFYYSDNSAEPSMRGNCSLCDSLSFEGVINCFPSARSGSVE